jgi:hypothetical protein
MRVEGTYSEVQTPTNTSSVTYFDFRIVPEKLSLSAKEHPSMSAHGKRRLVWGLLIYGYHFFIPTDFRA